MTHRTIDIVKTNYRLGQAMDKAEIIHLSHDNFKFSGHTLDKVWTWTYFGQHLDLDKLLTKLIFYVLDKHWTKFRP